MMIIISIKKMRATTPRDVASRERNRQQHSSHIHFGLSMLWMKLDLDALTLKTFMSVVRHRTQNRTIEII
jgi:hypothetical protein